MINALRSQRKKTLHRLRSVPGAAVGKLTETKMRAPDLRHFGNLPF